MIGTSFNCENGTATITGTIPDLCGATLTAITQPTHCNVTTDTSYSRILDWVKERTETMSSINGEKNIVTFNGKQVTVKSPYSLIENVVMPDIINVRAIEQNGEMKAVIVYFADGTSQKAAISGGDTFDLEHGISICLTKKLLNMKCNEHGSSVYNKLVRHGMKVYKNEQMKAEKERIDKEAANKKKKKMEMKKAAKRQKRKDAEREYLVGIQTEAYLRAMQELNASKTVAE